MSSQRKTSTQGNQDECKMNHMKPEDESPTQRRNRKNDIDEEARRMEDMRSAKEEDDSSTALSMEMFRCV